MRKSGIFILFLLFAASYSRSQPQRKPSLEDMLRVAKPLHTASNLNDVCQAYIRIETAEKSNNFRYIKDTDFQQVGHCLGYVTGWMDTVSGQLSCENGRLYTDKFIGEVQVGQTIRIFLHFIESHPEWEQEGAAAVLAKALADKNMTASFGVPFSECKQ